MENPTALRGNLTGSQMQVQMEVGFVAAFEDCCQDKFGHFPLPAQGQSQLEIFRRIIELEPSIRNAGYILGDIRLPEQQNISVGSVEYHKEEIQTLLAKLKRPGIVRR